MIHPDDENAYVEGLIAKNEAIEEEIAALRAENIRLTGAMVDKSMLATRRMLLETKMRDRASRLAYELGKTHRYHIVNVATQDYPAHVKEVLLASHNSCADTAEWLGKEIAELKPWEETVVEWEGQ
jgi:hypothetical protein